MWSVAMIDRRGASSSSFVSPSLYSFRIQSFGWGTGSISGKSFSSGRRVNLEAESVCSRFVIGASERHDPGPSQRRRTRSSQCAGNLWLSRTPPVRSAFSCRRALVQWSKLCKPRLQDLRVENIGPDDSEVPTRRYFLIRYNGCVYCIKEVIVARCRSPSFGTSLFLDLLESLLASSSAVCLFLLSKYWSLARTFSKSFLP